MFSNKYAKFIKEKHQTVLSVLYQNIYNRLSLQQSNCHYDVGLIAHLIVKDGVSIL